jgi:uridine kinase
MSPVTRRIVYLGLALRIVCVAVIVPAIHKDLFHPFARHFWNHPSLDPWTHWVDFGGRSDAFPYGAGLTALMYPLGAFPVGVATALFGAFAVALDLVCAKAIIRRAPFDLASVLWALSPLAIFVTYVHGQTDLVLAVTICASLFWVDEQKWTRAGIALGIAAAVKLSALLVVPFIFAFLLDNPRYRQGARKFLTSLILMGGVLQLPLVYSSGYRKMALRSPEGLRLLDYRIAFRDDFAVLVLPLVYLGMLYALWRLGRSTTKVLMAFSASALFSLAVLTPGGVGWLIWVFPAMVVLVGRMNRRITMIFLLFQFVAVIYFARIVTLGDLRFGGRTFDLRNWQLSVHQEDLLRTVFIGLGFLIVASLLRDGINKGDPLRIGKSPITVAIAGDSSTGKDTLANAIAEIFPLDAPQMINGDDYHLYERGHSAWMRMTHLNPKANDLTRQALDVQRMLHRDPVQSREYSHIDGQFSDLRTRKPADVVIVNGLHSLLLRPVQDRFDTKIFISMEEDLRVHLKCERDFRERGASAERVLSSIRHRQPDYENFVSPQESRADLIFRVQADGFEADGFDLGHSHTTCLTISTRDSRLLARLIEALNSVALARIEVDEQNHDLTTLKVWPGSLSQSENRWVLRTLSPDVFGLLDLNSTFRSGLSGLMSVVAVSSALSNRLERQS